ncbi:hypothetical protein [Dactylosporangium sp. NPDC051541]|uniref:hypothetical protein n=1 Tax=Dactylosporangium sp. NPDC051541 TaxID=3363977 RepID=UPI0037ACC6B9
MSPAARAATLQARRSARFVAWVRAWRAGLVPCDDAAAEISGDEEHMVSDVPGTWTDVSLPDALAPLSKLHPDEVRLVLPVPGDPRGLPGPGPFTSAALLAGEGVIAGELGFVPEVRLHTSGSGDEFETVRWQVFALPQERPRTYEPSTAEAEAELSAELVTATRTLAKLDIAQWRPELAGAIEAIRKPDGATDLPPGYDPRARRLYARASVLDRVLALAEHAAPGGAVNGYEVQQRDAALRPLTTACRRALVAACNAPML